jgi:hypothetical protein
LFPGGQDPGGPFGLRWIGRILPTRQGRLVAGTALFAAAALLPHPAAGVPAPEAPFRSEAGPQDRSEARTGGECGADIGDILAVARALADGGEPDPAAALLEPALEACPDHPGVLADLAGLRVLQGRMPEAELLASRLVRIRPESGHGWELLALTRYLRDDTRGALRAWNQVGRPLIHDVEVRVLGHSGPRTSEGGVERGLLEGLAGGQVLTVGGLVRGERRLGAIPAADRAQLGFRMVPGGEATVAGTVVLGAGNPFSRSERVAHALRLVVRRVHLVSADPLGRLEHWELSGTMEGTLIRTGLTLAHPAPGGQGVWEWGLEHETGRYAPGAPGVIVRETRSGLGWSHTDWVTSTLRGSVHGHIDARPTRGTFGGVGAAWTLVPHSARGALGAEGTGWMRIGGQAAGGDAPAMETRYGRVEVRGVIHALRSRGWEGRTDARGVGLDLRGGVVAVSGGAPADVAPRIGSGGNTDLLMRARTDLDRSGAVRPTFPGTVWAHGGIEVLRPLAAIGPAFIDVGFFVDGVRVLSPPEGLNPERGRRGAVQLGGGLRARLPWVDGWLRADWGIDPHDGASTLSAAWVREHRLLRLSAH